MLENQCAVNNTIQDKTTVSILVGLSAIISLTLLPFLVMRFMAGNWVHGSFNLVLFLIFVFNGLYAYKTKKTELPKMVFAIAIMSGLFIGFNLKGVEEVPWSYPGLVALFFTVRPRLAALFCSICIAWIAVFLYPLIGIWEFITYLFTIGVTCWAVYVFSSLSSRQHQDLINLSLRDPLTNLFNRRAFDQRLDVCVRSLRESETTSLVILDIDYFKRLNDELGHSVGDEVLCALGRLMMSQMRRSDCFYRIGGEEFAVILPNTNSEQAKNVANKLRETVEQASLVPAKSASDKPVTISLGAGEYDRSESKDSWFKRCDDALYIAKDSGRNNVKLAKTEPVS